MWNWNCPHGFITGGNSNCCCWLPHFYINKIICTMGPFELCMILEKSAYNKDASNILRFVNISHINTGIKMDLHPKNAAFWNWVGLKTNKKFILSSSWALVFRYFTFFLCDGTKVFKKFRAQCENLPFKLAHHLSNDNHSSLLMRKTLPIWR